MWPKTTDTKNEKSDDIQQFSFLKQFTLKDVKEFSNVHHKKE